MTETVVVTGAAGGLGRAIARAFGARSARVALLARGTAGLDAAKAEIEQSGGIALALPVDMADADRVDAAAAEVEHHFGPIDIWVNCAMATIFSRFWDITPEEYRRATEVTYLGYVWGTMAAVKRMRARDRGTIVQVGSALSYRAIPLQSPYCGAKFAIRGFTDGIRTELIHDHSNVQITMVQMPAMNTPQFDWALNKMEKRPQPVPPIFQPEVGAEAVVYAAYARRREIYVGWPTVKAILGNKLAPGLLDRYLARDYAGQLSDEPTPADRSDNLFNPLPGDRGAHGRFDDKATSYSVQLWLSQNRTLVAALGAAALGVIGGSLFGGGKRKAPLGRRGARLAGRTAGTVTNQAETPVPAGV